MSTKKIITLTICSILCFSIATYAGFTFVNYLVPSSNNNVVAEQPQRTVAPSIKLVDAQSYCPLNGKEYSVQDQARWEQLRPVAVMIENHPDSRPQSGLSAADIVYEAVAEGGITRFMALYLCNEVPRFVGPVRSARTYFLDWVSEYNSLYAHVGGANTPGPADALAQIATYGIKSINEIPLGRDSLTAGFQRIEDRLGRPVSLEHTMYLEIQKLRSFAAERFQWGVATDGSRWDSTFEKWKYHNGTQPADNSLPKTNRLSYNFWESSAGFNVEWRYDPTTKLYSRLMNNQPHIDNNTKQQITASNVIIMVQKESRANDGYPGNLHLLYQTIGKGDAYVMNNGNVIKASWSKSGRTARTKFIDATGKELSLQRGLIWISIVPDYSAQAIVVTEQPASPSATVRPTN